MIELAGVVILGILAQWIAWRLRIPAILPLILVGLLVGPISIYFSDDGTPWILPIWNGEKGLFPGDELFYFVSLAIGIILFEGGLTLRREEITKVGNVIGKLISLGAMITFIGAGIAAHYFFHLNWRIAFLFSSLIIVTGPTVITPILRNIPLKRDVSAVLKWEGILIDPIGALVAVLMFEFISVNGDAGFTKQALLEFGKIAITGFSFGISAGWAFHYIIKNKMVPHYLFNVVSLSVVLLVFVLSDAFAHESGLLAVVIMGMFLGNSNLPQLRELLDFKESLSILLISILFILLAANMKVEEMFLVFNWDTLLLIASIIFVIRPLGVFASTWKSNLSFKEKIFISWVGPRGIVAAGIASLFGPKLVQLGIPEAEYITPLVFSIVLVTVLLNATTARLFARLIGVLLERSEGILIIGASKASRIIAAYLKSLGRDVILVDTNTSNIERAKEMNIETLKANIFSEDLTENLELSDVGYLFALTANDEINKVAISKFSKSLGEHGSFRLKSPFEIKHDEEVSNSLSESHDFFLLSQIAENYPSVHEIDIKNELYFNRLISIIKDEKTSRLALFLKDKKSRLHILADKENIAIGEGCQLVYIGKPLDLELLTVEETEINK